MKKTVEPLGSVGLTARGFELIEFKDHNGMGCDLQASSLALYERPGTSAVWLGRCDQPNAPGPRAGCRADHTFEKLAEGSHFRFMTHLTLSPAVSGWCVGQSGS